MNAAMPSGWVGILTCELHFPEAHSLKEKRHHLRSAKARRVLERGRARRLDLLEQLLSETTDEEIEAVRVAAETVERALHA